MPTLTVLHAEESKLMVVTSDIDDYFNFIAAGGAYVVFAETQ